LIETQFTIDSERYIHTKKLLASTALLFASTAIAMGATNLTGKWNIHTRVAGNEGDQECKFVQTENKLTGTSKSTETEAPITGSIDATKSPGSMIPNTTAAL
jgi:hypothetical protein